MDVVAETPPLPASPQEDGRGEFSAPIDDQAEGRPCQCVVVTRFAPSFWRKTDVLHPGTPWHTHIETPARRELGRDASWSVSSCKPGFGVTNLRDGRVDTYWQYGGDALWRASCDML